MSQKRWLILIVTSVLFIFSLWHWRGTFLPLFCENPLPLIQKHFSTGGAFVDRESRILRVIADERDDISIYIPLASHSKDLLNAVMLIEDRNFYSHSGVDLLAVIRAMWQNITSSRIVSGASTITQQLIRVVKPRQRTFSTKISEALMAMRLELSLSKNQILEYYLNAVSMFGNVRGVSLSAHILFGKSPEMLNLAESATLAAAIQAPGRYNPFKTSGNKLLLRRRNRILKGLLSQKQCTQKQYENAKKEIIPNYRRKIPFNAPHFCDLLLKKFGKPLKTQTTTINLDLQNFLYSTLQSHISRLQKRGATQVSAMIADSKSMEILAMCGSAEYGPVNKGFNNGCISYRSGGSILKPFLYALAFESGYYPSFILADTMQSFRTPRGDYMPYNADRRSYGPVTIRSALGNSLNISAIKMLNIIGIGTFFSLLTELDILKYKVGATDFFGLGLAIGNPEIRMLELLQAYGIFRNNGNFKTIKFFPNQKQRTQNFISEQSAFMTFDILSDHTSRLFTFGNPFFFKSERPVAIKTGTSTDYRDCWLVAVNSEFIITIWIGNFSGTPTRGLSGANACGPIFKNLIDFLEQYKYSQPVSLPKGIIKKQICAISGQGIGLFCPLPGYDLFSQSSNKLSSCNFHKTEGKTHELSIEYASWIKKRRKHFDKDPFKLEGNIIMSDPWDLLGTEKIKFTPIITSSAPIIINSESSSYGWQSIDIVSPHDGDWLIISPSHENFVQLRAIPSEAVAEIIWLIDGKEFIRTPPPYEAYWPLEAGMHRISAITNSHVADEIEIMVEY